MEGNQEITEVKAKMLDAVDLIIEHWPAVRLALESGWISKNHRRLRESDEADLSGHQTKVNETEEDVKRRFVNELTDFIYDFEVDEFAIEDFLTDFVDANFYVILEDDSQRQIAKLLNDLNKTLSKGDDSVYEHIKEMARKFGKQREEEEKKKEEKEKEREEEQKQEEPPQLVDEDGFTTVTTKKGKKKY